FDPEDPIWPNRDRLVLSFGHASMLLYSMLHLCGVRAVDADYERLGAPCVTLDDIKKFRQLDSKCPGHPEYRWTSGIETTTGPLGQGYATSVGMAMAGKWLGATYNKPNFEMFNFDVYALGGDGCMMEGAASEAASLAGHLKLDSHIAYGAPTLQDSHKAHGAPLGKDEIKGTKQFYGMPENDFCTTDAVYDDFKNNIGRRGAEARTEWMAKYEAYKAQYPQLADQMVRIQRRQLPEGWEKAIPTCPTDAKGVAGRSASSKVLN